MNGEKGTEKSQMVKLGYEISIGKVNIYDKRYSAKLVVILQFVLFLLLG